MYYSSYCGLHICDPLNSPVPLVMTGGDSETLGLDPALCNWVLDFLTGRPQVVMVGNNISTPLILNTGAPQGCVLSPLLYSLFTHDCVAMHASNTIIKFADDTTVVYLITNNDETAYRGGGEGPRSVVSGK